MLIKMLLQFFIREIDAELLKTIAFETFKPIDIQNSNNRL
jgi:hypothetical protein